ncbi:extracellular solute-binding protein [Pigmentiphaga litoralis]|uniref:extracellular solute-binding protein n=1 Tax=Pigmentiphaga litoralis TaxID=516702 RepID=UPI003B43317E
MQQPNSWRSAGVSALAAAIFMMGGLSAVQAQTKPAAKPSAKAAAKPAAKAAPAKAAAPAKSTGKGKAAAAAGGAAAAAAAGSALAADGSKPASGGPIELEVWHALNKEQSQEFNALVDRFNAQNIGFTVKVRTEPTQEKLIQDGIASIRAKRQPHLIQISDNHSPELIAQQGAVLPMFELLNKYPIKDLRWFLPQTTGTMRDSKNRLLALPFMAEAPVYMYNRDLYKQAGLDPDAPPKTWRDMQKHLIALSGAGVSCPYATSSQTWIHLENLSALHNTPYASKNNGLDGSNGAVLLANDLLHVRHLALMMSWVRSKLFPVRSEGDQADAQFASGECAILTTGTGALAKVQADAKFSYGVAPLPYYEEEATKPSNPFVGGSSLWALAGHSAAEQKAVAQFIAYLASPVVAADWSQKTGFLPLTEAAYRASGVSYYKSIPGAESVVREMAAVPAQYTRGFRLNNYYAVSRVLDEELDDVWSGKKPPKQGLDDGVSRASLLMNPPGPATAAATKKPAARSSK